MREYKAGFVGFGEVNTPREFIDERCELAASKLEALGISLVKASPVSDVPDGSECTRAIGELRQGDWDALVVCVAGWIPTWAVITVLEQFRDKPMVLWGLSGWEGEGHWVTTADQAGTTALRFPLEQMGYTFKYVVSKMRCEWPVDQVASYVKAACTAAWLRGKKIGMAGYRDMRLYGTLYDGMALKRDLGLEIEHFELLEAYQLMDQVDDGQVQKLAKQVRERWVFTKEPQPGTVENSVRLFLAFKKIIEDRGYSAFSYNDVDGVKRLMQFAPAGALTLLHDEMEIPTVPENDCPGSATQLLVQGLTGQLPPYLEFYEFTPAGALMGVPDYVPGSAVDGKVTVMPNAFGSFGEGLLNVSKLKTGKVTLVRLAPVAGKYVMHVVIGVAEPPPAWEEAGWTPPAPQLPSLHVKLDGGSDAFIQKVLGQHYIVAYGDWKQEFEELASLLNIDLY